MQLTETLARRPWTDVELPADVLAVPTMLSSRERQLLYWLARYYVNGSGRIVDGGSFLGGSTAALAAGLAARTDRSWDKNIAAFDRFTIEPYTIENFGSYFSDCTVGASFLDAFERNMAPWRNVLDVRDGDILYASWTGEPIEILFLDMIKNWVVNDFVLRTFFPCLIPGRSIILQQDYLWGFGPWLHITMELLSDCVTRLDSMPNGTVAYLLTSPIPRELTSGKNLRDSLPLDRRHYLMDQAVSRWEGDERGLVELARVMLIAETDTAAAQAEFVATLARNFNSQRVVQCAPYVAQCLADATKKWLRLVA